MQVLYGTLLNLDTVSRNGNVRIADGSGNVIGALLGGVLDSVAISANDSVPIPGAAATSTTGQPQQGRFIVGGSLEILATLASVADGQESDFSLVTRIRGRVPTVVEAGGGTPTVTINLETVL